MRYLEKGICRKEIYRLDQVFVESFFWRLTWRSMPVGSSKTKRCSWPWPRVYLTTGCAFYATARSLPIMAAWLWGRG